MFPAHGAPFVHQLLLIAIAAAPSRRASAAAAAAVVVAVAAAAAAAAAAPLWPGLLEVAGSRSAKRSSTPSFAYGWWMTVSESRAATHAYPRSSAAATTTRRHHVGSLPRRCSVSCDAVLVVRTAAVRLKRADSGRTAYTKS